MERTTKSTVKAERVQFQLAKAQKRLEDGKKPALQKKGKGKKNSVGKELTGWVRYEELDPECTFFPPSAISRVTRSGTEENRCYTLRLGADSAVTTDGSGLLATVFANTISAAQNWSSYAAVFDEYRILAFSVEFEPLWQAGGSTATYWAPIASVVDRSDATALTGMGLASRYESCKKVPGQRKWRQTVTMQSVEDGSFVSTTTTASNAWIKVYSSGNSLSLTIGRANIVWIAQFRGLGIN